MSYGKGNPLMKNLKVTKGKKATGNPLMKGSGSMKKKGGSMKSGMSKSKSYK